MNPDPTDHFQSLRPGVYVLRTAPRALLPANGDDPIPVTKVDDYSPKAGQVSAALFQGTPIRNQVTNAVTFF